jgi:plasmid stabilization system protein ParE
MSIVFLPDALDDLLALQDYMLDRWTLALWLKAEDEIFAKLTEVESGFLSGTSVPAFVAVGISSYKTILTSHHRILYRSVEDTLFVYAVAGHQQDFQTLLLKRLFKR